MRVLLVAAVSLLAAGVPALADHDSPLDPLMPFNPIPNVDATKNTITIPDPCPALPGCSKNSQKFCSRMAHVGEASPGCLITTCKPVRVRNNLPAGTPGSGRFCSASPCPAACNPDTQILCYDAANPDTDGCPKEGECLPNTDRYGCPHATCPPECADTQQRCYPGFSNGCLEPQVCEDLDGYVLETGQICFYPCETHCDPDNEIKCSGGKDADGCDLADICLPEKIASTVDNSVMCNNYCPEDNECAAGEHQCFTRDANGCQTADVECVAMADANCDPDTNCASYNANMCGAGKKSCLIPGGKRTCPVDQYECIAEDKDCPEFCDDATELTCTSHYHGEERSYCIPKEVDGCTNHCPPSCKSNEKLCRPARDSSNPECPGMPQCVAQAEDTECPVFCPKVCPDGYYNCIQNLPIMIAGTEHTCPVGTSNCIKYDSDSCSKYCPDPTQCAVDEIQCDTRPRPLDGAACINEPGAMECVQVDPEEMNWNCPPVCEITCKENYVKCPGGIDPDNNCPLEDHCVEDDSTDSCTFQCPPACDIHSRQLCPMPTGVDGCPPREVCVPLFSRDGCKIPCPSTCSTYNQVSCGRSRGDDGCLDTTQPMCLDIMNPDDPATRVCPDMSTCPALSCGAHSIECTNTDNHMVNNCPVASYCSWPTFEDNCTPKCGPWCKAGEKLCPPSKDHYDDKGCPTVGGHCVRLGLDCPAHDERHTMNLI